jgi:hypothetical protein
LSKLPKLDPNRFIHDDVESRYDDGNDHDDYDVQTAYREHDDAVPCQNPEFLWAQAVPEARVANQKACEKPEMCMNMLYPAFIS